MTIPTTEAESGPYYPNGATVAFPFGFKAVQASDVAVVRIDDTGAITTLSSALYSVSLAAGDDPGGTVLFTAAPAEEGGALWILSDPPFIQEVKFEDEGVFNQSILNRVADQAGARSVWLRAQVDRAIKVPFGEVPPELPSPAATPDGSVLGVFDGGLRFIPEGGDGSVLRAQLLGSTGSGIVGTALAIAGAVERTTADKLSDFKTIKDFGCKADTRLLTNGSTAAGVAALNALGAGFTAADVGKAIAIRGAGPGGAELVTTITAFVSVSKVDLADAATTTVANALVYFGTIETAAFAAAMKKGLPVRAPALFASTGNYAQLPYFVAGIDIPNGAMLYGDGQTWIKQTAGANRDLVKPVDQNVSNVVFSGFLLDGSKSAQASGCGFNFIGNAGSVASYNPQVHPDPYCLFSDLFIFNCKQDGFRVAGAALDGTAWRAGGSTIRNIKTLGCDGRGAYLALYDAHITDIDCGASGKQAVIFDPTCGSLRVDGVKGWYSGMVDPTQGECLVIGGGQSKLVNVVAQANIPGHGIKLVGFYESMLDFVVQGAGNVAGFGATPAYLYVGVGSTAFKARGVCSQTAGAPIGNINLLDFSAGGHANYTIDISHSGAYTSLMPLGAEFPLSGGGGVQSIVLNGREQLGRSLVPVYPAAQNPASGWTEYCDANNNALTARNPAGLTIPLTPLEYSIASLPAPAANIKGMRAFIVNGVAAPALASVPGATGTTYCPVYCDGAAWRYG